jgi:branched-chain amino acid transport system ATP-binding protein
MGGILEVKNLSKSFGGLSAVKNVSFELKEGELLSLIGPNGAGKTTLFNLITGFYRPDAGSIVYMGKDVTGLPPHRICRKGIVRTFQIVRPFGNMTVLNNVITAASTTKGLRDAVRKSEEILKFTGLWGKKDLLARNLTIADKKRLELARALATDPKVMLLDEVIAGLNPREIEEALEIIRRIHADGISIIMVEHVMRAVMSISERIIVLHHGEKIAEGAPSEIASDERVIKAYLGEAYADARGR